MSSEDTVYDLVGLGFGPANIAIAGAITEGWQQSTDFPIKKTLFIEKHDVFRWHPGMLLPDAKMQINFMKDLATLRNPASPYTFLSYLHSEDRLLSFINRGSTIPTRKEYSDYLSWAAKKVQESGIGVMYGHEVVNLDQGPEDTIQVSFRNVHSNEEIIIRTRDLVISPGGSPRIPEFLVPYLESPHVLHSSAYATNIGRIFKSLSCLRRPLHVGVIGSGQSAAEVTLDLRNQLSSIFGFGQRHTVDMLIRKGSLKPSDDSPFANEIFDPAATDAWFSLPSQQLRKSILAEYKQTNYGVVNPRTIEALYEIVYDQRLNSSISRRTGIEEGSNPIINVKPYTSIVKVSNEKKTGGGSGNPLLTPEENDSEVDHPTFRVTSQNTITGAFTEENYDILVYATGYQRSGWVDMLKNTNIGKYFGLSPASTRVTLRPWTDVEQPTLFTQGNSRSETPSPASSSPISTPSTSPGTSTFSAQFSFHVSHDLYLSRNYQLFPSKGASDGSEPLVPRVYLQGVEEATHGLSDTLLSVLGVRAGEVVGDLCRRYVQTR